MGIDGTGDFIGAGGDDMTIFDDDRTVRPAFTVFDIRRRQFNGLPQESFVHQVDSIN